MSKNDLPGNIRLRAVLVLTVVFVVGAASGAALWHGYMTARMPPPPPPMMGPLPIHGLDLTPEQQKKVDEIIEAHRPQLDAVLKETFPRVRAVNEEIEASFLQILTEEQKKRFDELKSHRAFRPPFGMRPGMGPGMHPGMGPGMRPGMGPGGASEMEPGVGPGGPHDRSRPGLGDMPPNYLPESGDDTILILPLRDERWRKSREPTFKTRFLSDEPF